MKLGCCSWSYHRSFEAGHLTFDGWLTLCAEALRVDGVDIIADHLPRQTKTCWLETKKRCADLRLTIISFSPSNNFGRPTAADRRAELERVRRWIDAAFVMGAPYLRLFAGWPPAGRREALWGPMVECLRIAARSAAQAGVTLVIEPHNDGGFLPDSRSTLRLMRELDSPWVRINLDTGNYQEPDSYAGLEASLPYAAHVVAKIHHLNDEGDETTLDYTRIFTMLARVGYRGFVTVEYEGQAEERPSVPKAVAMLRRYANAHGV